jgi:hypothetical protein
MSDIKKQLEVDMARFLDNIETQNRNDRLETLRNLMDKYLHLTTCEHVMDHHDLINIISNAKGSFANNTFPIYLGDKKIQVSPSDLSNLCVIESTVSYLNNKECLKKMPKFNKKKE